MMCSTVKPLTLKIDSIAGKPERLPYYLSYRLPHQLFVATSLISGAILMMAASTGMAADASTWGQSAITSPRSAKTIDQYGQSTLEQAETDYQGGRYDAAIAGFGVVAANRDHPFAWLRVGNIWHRRGNAAMALHAYANAQDAAERDRRHDRLRDRATMNIALLGLDQVRLAFESLSSARGAAVTRQWRNEVGIRLKQIDSTLPGVKNPSQAGRPSIKHGSPDPAKRIMSNRRRKLSSRLNAAPVGHAYAASVSD